jgi:abortive infection bacteriophage resistance protein
MARTFQKKAETPAVLVQKLIAQGLHVADRASAQRVVEFVGHYRLKGYWFHLIDPATRQFPPGTTFEALYARYDFDRALRRLVMDHLERIEVAIRTVMSNFLSLKYGPHWFLNLGIFKSSETWSVGSMLQKIEQEIGRAKKRLFVESFYNHYDDPHLPPSWAVVECVTFGMWSQTFGILRDPQDKKAIASKFGLDTEVFGSWARALTVLRNIAAHHDRLLRRNFHVMPVGCKSKKIKFPSANTLYAQATVMHVLLDAMGDGADFKQALNTLFTGHSSGGAYKLELGFPATWPSGQHAGW